jgi:hydrogenase maturation protease
VTQSGAQVDDVGEVSTCALVVIGCGNLLRGDDGVGPILIRHLWQGGVPDSVRLVDGGTAGMDVSFQMRGAERVIIVDASRTGEPAGTTYRIPGPAVEDLPPLGGLHTHMFRWDNALAFGRWLLGDGYPKDVTVYLIEATGFEPGAPLSAPVERAMHEVIDLIRAEPAFGVVTETQIHSLAVEFTDQGYLRVDAAMAEEFFPGGTAAVLPKDDELWMFPLQSTASGGLVLKQRNAKGDRSVLVREVLADSVPLGSRPARWDDVEGALRITLDARPDVDAGR